ncbi:MAG: hypothetical protein ACRDA5_13640, partial [Clostridium sp.]
FRMSNRDETLFLLRNLSGYSERIIKETIIDLEENLGIISFDNRTNSYDFIEDATGINDFNRFIRKKKNALTIPLGAMINESIYEKIGISSNIKPDFTVKNNIKTSEWQFEQVLLPIDEINNNYLENFIKEYNSKTSVDKAKAKIIYVYYNGSYDYLNIERLMLSYKRYELNKYPIVMVLVDDKDNELEELIVATTIINKLTEEEKMKYSKFISKYSSDIEERLALIFRDLLREKQIIIEKLTKVEKRISIYCNEVLTNLYPNIIPFSFDGFDAKSISNAKKFYMSVCRWLITGNSVNEQGYHLLTREVKNRVEAVLRNNEIGWGILNNKLQFVYPTNIKVKKIFDEITEIMSTAIELNISDIYYKYLKTPYGLNDYSFTLVLLCYIIYQQNTIKVIHKGKKYKINEWAIHVLNDKAINIKVLLDSKIVKVEIQGYGLKYLDLCERIEKNNDISIFENLLAELENIIVENDPPEELQSRVDGARIRADHGIKIYRNKQNKIGLLKGTLESGTESYDFRKIISAI